MPLESTGEAPDKFEKGLPSHPERGKSEDVSNTEANPGSPGASVVVAFKSGSSPCAPGARQGAPPRRPTPRRAPGRPPRAGALPRAEDPGRASSRQACELPPSGAPGEPRLAAAAEPAAAFPFLPHPRLARGVLPGRGPAPPSGPYPGPPSLPPQPVSGRRSPRGVEREEPRGPDRASGAAPGSQRDVPKSNLSGGSRKRNSAGSAPATLFPPPDSLPPPSPAFLPSATRALRPSPCLCLAVSPPLASHSYLFVPHPLGTPALPLPPDRMDRPAGR
ncbi:hypothetical protein H8959_015431 [Pygathrix nigripes]